MKPLIIGIAGGTGSGKTTLVNRLLEQYRDGREIHRFRSREEAAAWLRDFDAKAD